MDMEKTDNVAVCEDDRVDLFVPRGAAGDEPYVFIGVNGVSYLLPKGKTSRVPRHVKAEYDRSVTAQHLMDERADELRAAANMAMPSTCQLPSLQ